MCEPVVTTQSPDDETHAVVSEHGLHVAVWSKVSVGGGAWPNDACSNKDVGRCERVEMNIL